MNDQISIGYFESFVFTNKNLEQEIGEGNYLDLVSLNYKHKEAKAVITTFIHQRLISRGQFETVHLKRLLEKFIEDSKNADKYLDKFYHLYCGALKDNGVREYAFKFLGHLGLNYLYWIDEAYMRLNHGDKWEKEYKRSVNEIEFYQRQLKPFAEEILQAINTGEIRILDDGTYEISLDLKIKLESDRVYKLQHSTVR